MTSHLLLVECPDATGLVHKITGVLYRHKFNIVNNHEFVDPLTRHFFMRTAFSGSGSTDALMAELVPLLPAAATIRITPTRPRPIVVLATKEHHCLGDLLLRHAYHELPARICAVVSNHDVLAPLVEKFGIPFHHIGHEGLGRDEHEDRVLEAVAAYKPEFLVLAKYMRILSPRFVEHYPHRIINIHHSFLPAFIGASPYRQAFERGVKQIGATAHIVTEDLDTGPIIAQGIMPVDHTHTAEDMAQSGRDVEKVVLAKAVKLVLEERVFLYKNRTVIFE